MLVRRYKPGDEEQVWRIYHDTTHIVNGRDYTPEQCERWAPAEIDMGKWAQRLQRLRPFVAEGEEGNILGFAELEPDGRIVFFYCHHKHQRQGIGTLLYSALESEARRLGISELRADVSLSAKAFFLSRGFHVVREQHNIICGTPAPNFIMRKALGEP